MQRVMSSAGDVPPELRPMIEQYAADPAATSGDDHRRARRLRLHDLCRRDLRRRSAACSARCSSRRTARRRPRRRSRRTRSAERRSTRRRCRRRRLRRRRRARSLRLRREGRLATLAGGARPSASRWARARLRSRAARLGALAAREGGARPSALAEGAARSRSPRQSLAISRGRHPPAAFESFPAVAPPLGVVPVSSSPNIASVM